MSDDLEKRLRECATDDDGPDIVAACIEAADELARLRSENEALNGECERLREAIKAHNDGCNAACLMRAGYGSSCAFRNPDGSYRYGDKKCSDCPAGYTIEVPEGAAK